MAIIDLHPPGRLLRLFPLGIPPIPLFEPFWSTRTLRFPLSFCHDVVNLRRNTQHGHNSRRPATRPIVIVLPLSAPLMFQHSVFISLGHQAAPIAGYPI